MRCSGNKYMLIFLALILIQCRKDKFEYEKGTSCAFGSEGRNYTFYQNDISSAVARNVIVQIPAGAVTKEHSLLFNSFQLSDHTALAGHYIDFYLSDINYFICSCAELNTPATIILPYREIMNWAGYGYSVFYVNVSADDNMFDALNDTLRWTEVPPPYIVDNIEKTVSFNVTDLNGVYVVAKEK